VLAPIGWILIIFANIPSIAGLLLPKGQSLGNLIYVGWLAVTITLVILYFAKAKLLPSAVLLVKEDESFVRRHAAELSLMIALASAIITATGWILRIFWK